MFDTCSTQWNVGEQTNLFKHLLFIVCRRSLVFLAFVILVLSLCLFGFYNFPRQILFDRSNDIDLRKPLLPTLARVLYLFLCENQAEIDTYSQLFPSVSADAIFYCWRENCHSTRFRSSNHFYVQTWSSPLKQDQSWVSMTGKSSFHFIQTRIFILNENELRLKEKSTWTTARNTLYQFALNEEEKQRWKWAYYIFADGDIHIACPLADQLLTNQSIVDYGRNEELLFAKHFQSFVNLTTIQNNEEKCFLLFDAFLLSISPAIATVTGSSGPMAYPGLLTQVVYHIDAMFNAIHRDALTFLLPYCPRYDRRSWWTSQAIFVYRSLCFYGHILQFDGVHIARQNHRVYPRVGSPWSMDDDMNLVPDHLLRLKNYMKQSRFVSALVLHHYSGWNLQLTSSTCRQHHTAMRIDTCLVYGKNQTK